MFHHLFEQKTENSPKFTSFCFQLKNYQFIKTHYKYLLQPTNQGNNLNCEKQN